MAETKLPKLPAGVSEAFLELMENPVSFHPAIARLCGGAQAGLMCSQAIYWSRMKQVQERGGWFYKTAEEWEEETCLSRREQDTAKLVLKKLGFIETKLEKVNGAPTLHFRVKFQRILEVFFQSHGGQMECTDTPNGLHENAKSENTDPPNALPQSAKTIDCTKTPNPVHENAKSYKEQETSAGDFQETSSRGEQKRPPSPSMMIAREKLAEYIRRNGPLSSDPEYDKKLFCCILAGRGGLSPTQAKEFLAEDPEWRKWGYLAVLDSQQEINFPEPEKPKPMGQIVYPSDFISDNQLWHDVLWKLQKTITRHSYDTWLKPTKAFGMRRRILYVSIPCDEFRQIGEKFGDEIEQAIASRADDVKFLTQQQMAEQQWEATA